MVHTSSQLDSTKPGDTASSKLTPNRKAIATREAIATPADPSKLLARMEQLKPWRQNIQVTEDVSTGSVLTIDAPPGSECVRSRNRERDKFLGLIDLLYPSGLKGKRFLDCGCNAAGFCFWARERAAELSFGFDIREHWIKQARFLKRHREVGPTDYVRLEVLSLYDLPNLDLDPFDIVQFKGLFYHLHDPIGGLKVAADHCRDVLLFSTAVIWGQADGSLQSVIQDCDQLHGSTQRLTWYPTGPNVCAELIRQLGFESIKLTRFAQVKRRPTRGRLEIVAARDKDRLDGLDGETI